LGGLTAAELATIRGRLEAFADDIFASLPRTDQRARGECYLRGLMLDGRRKSIEPMAQRLGQVHYQALHHFVAVSLWDWRPVRRRLAEVLTTALQPTVWAVWAVDDTGFPKDGTHSVGVQRHATPVLRDVGMGRWARPPTASWGCRSTRSPSRPAARWIGGCLCPKAGTSRRWRRGGRPATCPGRCTIGPSGSWCWTCWMSWPAGSFRRRCWSPAAATGRSGSSAAGWTSARSPMSSRSRPTPAPTPSMCTRPPRRIRGRAAGPNRATTTRRRR